MRQRAKARRGNPPGTSLVSVFEGTGGRLGGREDPDPEEARLDAGSCCRHVTFVHRSYGVIPAAFRWCVHLAGTPGVELSRLDDRAEEDVVNRSAVVAAVCGLVMATAACARTVHTPYLTKIHVAMHKICKARQWPLPVPNVVGSGLGDAMTQDMICFDLTGVSGPDGIDVLNLQNGRATLIPTRSGMSYPTMNLAQAKSVLDLNTLTRGR